MTLFVSSLFEGMSLLSTYINFIPPSKNNLYLSPLSNTGDSGEKVTDIHREGRKPTGQL